MENLSLNVSLLNLTDPTDRQTLTDFEEKHYAPNNDLITNSEDPDDIGGFSFSHLFNLSYSEALNESAVGQKIIVLGYINKNSLPYPVPGTDENGNLITISERKISIKEHNGYEIKCHPVASLDFENLDQLFSSKSLLLFEGTIIDDYDERLGPSYIFHLEKIYEDVTPLHLIGVKMEELERLISISNELEGRKVSVRQYIKETLVKNLGIKGLERAKELDKAIDFMILQSFSNGMNTDGRYSNKLHSLVIGSPAVGKKLLTMIARILNPVAFEIASTSAKVTPAGMVGNVTRNGNMIKSDPGYLPLANGGIICIQDFHEISKNKNELSGIFSMVMEDGKVIDSTSARTEHKAITSIHIDENRLSQVYPGKKYNEFDDINIPMNLISRFDFIIDIPPDLSRQYDVVLEMAKGEKVLLTNRAGYKTPQWQRDLKVMVAAHSAFFSAASINDNYSALIRSKFEDLIKANEQYATMQKHFPGMLTRLYNSVEKYTKALACSDGNTGLAINRSLTQKYSQITMIADDRFIDEAFSFIQSKLDILSKFEPMSIPDLSNSSKTPPKEIIYQDFKGKETSIKDICNEYNSKVRTKVSERTIRRYVEELEKEGRAFKSRKGFWSFNSQDNETRVE